MKNRKSILVVGMILALVLSLMPVGMAEAASVGNSVAKATIKATKAVTSVSLSKTSLDLKVGATSTLTATIKPSDATNKNVTWKSSNTAVATVDKSGKITAKKLGTATITVTTSSGSKKATCKVSVITPVTSVKLNATSKSLEPGKTYQLTATISPSNATKKTVSWKSSNTAVATVDKNGKITAKKVGTATITVTTSSGSKKATCAVTVSIPVKSVKLNATSKTLKKGDTYQLKATISPSNATNKTVTWSSSKSSVAKVDSKGKVTAVGKGSATITAKVDGKSVTCKITVTVKTVKRAFVIGQSNYRYPTTVLEAGVNDMRSMVNMLEVGGYKDNIYYGEDLTGAQLAQFLGELSTVGISSDDITLFYYSGHGASASTQAYRGALVGVDNYIVTVDDVQRYLDRVPGTVVVVLDCCLSGQYIESKAFAAPQSTISAAAFNQGILSTFSESMLTKALPDSPYKSKYKVITACQPLENSLMTYRPVSGGSYPISLFTFWLTKGTGFDTDKWAVTSMMADSDKNKVTTLKELQAYIQKGTTSQRISSQKVMIWPSNDTFPIAIR